MKIHDNSDSKITGHGLAQPLLYAILLAVFSLSSARADGPHWQVPNPDGDEYPGDGEEKKKDGEQKKDGEVAPPSKAPQGAGGKARGEALAKDYAKNPGSFLEMNKACVDYYERHCTIHYQPKDQNVDFYIKIMNRCAQVMREVDTYCPCPDSFPLWQTEELRNLMVEYAQRTWVRSAHLNKAVAERCAEFCVECFTDTVRFSEDRKAGRLNADWKAYVITTDNLAKLAKQMLEAKDFKTRLPIKQEWTKGHIGGWKPPSPPKDGGGYPTMDMVTGDITLVVDDAEMRMIAALTQMGLIVVPYLEKEARKGNPRIVQMAQLVISGLKASFQKAIPVATMNNVLEQIRWTQNKPGSPEAQNALRVLKQWGNSCVVHLLKIAEEPELASYAFKALAHATGRSFGNDLMRWQEFARQGSQPPALENKKPEPPKAEAPQEISRAEPKRDDIKEE